MLEDEGARAATEEDTGDSAWGVGVGLKTNEDEKTVTLEVAWDGAGAWAGDEAIGAGACATA